MANLEELVVQLVAETSSLRAEMNSAVKVTEQSMSKMEKSIEDFSKTSSKNTSFFTQTMASMTGFLASNIVTGAFNMVKNAVSALTGELIEGAEAAIAEENALSKLSNALLLSGNYSEAAAADLQDFASSMESLTGAQDDAIASSMSLLATINRLDAEGIKQAEKAILDFSAATGTDLNTATRMVSKALEGNTDSFRKYGIELTETKDKTKALEVVTGELGARFSGAAAGQAKTFGGVITNLQNSIGNLFEELATNVTKNEVVKAMLSELATIVGELTKAFKDSAPAIKEGLANALLFVADAGIVVVQVLKTLWAGLETLYTGSLLVVDSLQKVGASLGLLEDNDFSRTKESWDGLSKTVSGDSSFDTLSTKIAQVRNAGADAFGELKNEAEGVPPTIDKNTKAIAVMTEAQKAHNKAVQDWAKSLADTQNQIDSTYKFSADVMRNNFEIQKINSENALTVEQEFLNAKLEMQQMYFEQERAQLEAARAQGLVSETEYYAAVVGLNQQQTLATVELKKQQIQNEKDLEKQRTENLKSTLGTISSLQNSSSKELAAIGKAAAIAQATMDGYAAVQKALASAPPPFNYALAAAVGAATAANVAKIAGVGLQRGIDEVPGIGNQDNFPAVLAPGERVVPAKTNEDLTEFLKNEQKSGQTINVNVNFNAPVWSKDQAGADIVEAINEAIARGTTTGLIKA